MHRLLAAGRNVALEPRWGYDILRIYLGLALFIRGALFVANPDRVLALAQPSDSWFWPLLIAHGVGIGHVCGGLLLMAGLATRVAALAQIPILFGAVFFVHWREGLLGATQSLELAGLVLVMLVVYAVFGSGPLSLDQLVFRRARTEPPRRRESDRRIGSVAKSY